MYNQGGRGGPKWQMLMLKSRRRLRNAEMLLVTCVRN